MVFKVRRSRQHSRRGTYRTLSAGLDVVVGARDPDRAMDAALADGALAEDPRRSESLRPLLQLGSNLERVLREPIPEPPFGLRPGRARLLAATTGYRPPTLLTLPTHLTAGMRAVGKLAAAVVVILLLIMPVSRQFVGAARASVPGQLLYPLKIQVERVQYSGAAQPDVRVALGLAFLGERVAEIQALAGQGQPVDYEMAGEVQQLINQLLRSTAEVPEATMPDMLTYIAMQVQAYVQILDGLETSPAPAHNATLDQVRHLCERGVLVAHYGLLDPAKFRDAYQSGRPERFLLPGENPLEGPSAPGQHPVDAQGGM